jgi:hypothetical protein
MNPFEQAIADTVVAVLAGHRRATKYLSDILVVKASGQRKERKGVKSVTVVVTIGKPNYEQRVFISKCKRSGEPMPVKKIQIKEWKRVDRRRPAPRR